MCRAFLCFDGYRGLFFLRPRLDLPICNALVVSLDAHRAINLLLDDYFFACQGFFKLIELSFMS